MQVFFDLRHAWYTCQKGMDTVEFIGKEGKEERP